MVSQGYENMYRRHWPLKSTLVSFYFISETVLNGISAMLFTNGLTMMECNANRLNNTSKVCRWNEFFTEVTSYAIPRTQKAVAYCIRLNARVTVFMYMIDWTRQLLEPHWTVYILKESIFAHFPREPKLDELVWSYSGRLKLDGNISPLLVRYEFNTHLLFPLFTQK